MSIEPSQTFIDNNSYEYIPMGAKAARDNLVQLLKTLGPSWADALDGIKGSTIDASILGDDHESSAALMKVIAPLAGSVAGLIRGLVNGLSPSEYEKFVNVFLKRVSVETDTGGKKQLTPDVREFEFGTKLLTELRILIWCLQEQYSDFFESFGKVTGALSGMATTVASRFGSPNLSTGGSSVSPVPNSIPVGS